MVQMAKAKNTKKKASPSSTHTIKYPDVTVDTRTEDNPLTVDEAKEIIGWTVSTEGEDFGEDYFLKDALGQKVKLLNNYGNRPYTRSWADEISQEFLRVKWRFNGESIIVGKTGRTLSAQHRLTGFILAEQIRTGKMADYWKEIHGNNPITMPCVIVYGVSEDADVTRTLDIGKRRKLSDVLFCDDSVFRKAKTKDRTNICRMMEYTIRYLWTRTGADRDMAFAPKRTHSESMDFRERHPRIDKCVAHIFEENQPQKDDDGKLMPPPISRYLSPGYAAGMMYLMAASDSDGNVYRNLHVKNEKKLDWSQWDKASEFWVLLAGNSKTMKEVHYAFAELTNRGTFAEQSAIISKAWDAFKNHGEITAEDVKLEYTVNQDDMRVFTEKADFGGIDNPPEDKPDPVAVEAPTPEEEVDGSLDGTDESEEESNGPGEGDPTPEEIEAAAAEELEKKNASQVEKFNKRKAKKQPVA